MGIPFSRQDTCLFFRTVPDSNFAHRDTGAIVADEVEHHIQPCTAATNGFELLFTIVGSELLLAEVTTNAMATSKMRPIKSHRLTVSRLKIQLMSM